MTLSSRPLSSTDNELVRRILLLAHEIQTDTWLYVNIFYIGVTQHFWIEISESSNPAASKLYRTECYTDYNSFNPEEGSQERLTAIHDELTGILRQHSGNRDGRPAAPESLAPPAKAQIKTITPARNPKRIIQELAPTLMTPGEPLHYSDIADRINQKSEGHVTPYSVYITLCADERFRKVMAKGKKRALFELLPSAA